MFKGEQLLGNEFGVESAMLEKLRMRTLLAHLTLVNDDDPVGFFHGAQPVRDDDHCSASSRGVQRLLHLQGKEQGLFRKTQDVVLATTSMLFTD